ncbi:MAG TPA: aldolase [Methanoregulaceae archaeon]|nr:aldolase [Methanoregulaceae archaeon]HPD75885.1 aldolase [Methanoregulaceae archaeon]HRY75985.1 aldolase [Methanoregulaceae archaeon]
MAADDFARIGRRLVAEHLVGANFGNLSVCEGGSGFLIKRTGAYLDEPGEPVFVPFSGDVPKEASSEYRVHRDIYLMTPFRAIVHAHPPYAVAASLRLEEVIPLDSEGKMFCPRIPVVTGEPGTDELARNVADGLAGAPVVIARGHGTFAGGKDLDQAYAFTSLAEHACRVIAFLRYFEKE